MAEYSKIFKLNSDKEFCARNYGEKIVERLYSLISNKDLVGVDLVFGPFENLKLIGDSALVGFVKRNLGAEINVSISSEYMNEKDLEKCIKSLEEVF